MIRPVNIPHDASAITAIYNPYILYTVVSFETEALSETDMASRIRSIASHCPYFVYEEDGEVKGYCYAHPWKERAAYCRTLETTIYLAPSVKGRGVGKNLMLRLIEESRSMGFHSLIACVTGENTDSIMFHKKLGFKEVSRYKEVGFKQGRYLDVVDLQLML
ncbi:MAG: GNAT family N-acetyltransferase [Muribaculaceae bacterium]|nr:GNAT family N-acetyltransferase [Muribaculaceae bacterium]